MGHALDLLNYPDADYKHLEKQHAEIGSAGSQRIKGTKEKQCFSGKIF